MIKKIFIFFLVCVFLTGFVLAQTPYKRPPKEIEDIVTSPPPPRASISPTGELMALIQYESMPSIEYMSQPLLRIAGTRILPKYNSRQVTSFNTELSLKSIKEGKEIKVDLPSGIKFTSTRWSYDGNWLAFLRYVDEGVELWVVDAKTGKAKALTGPVINASVSSGFSWLPGSQRLLVHTILENRGNPPAQPTVPKGPNVQEHSGKVSKVRTYQDLLQTLHDEALFEYYGTSQIVEIDPATGQSRKIGSPGIYLYEDASPDRKLLLVYKIKRPYSYFVPYYSFTHSLEIWDREGKLVHLLAEIPLADQVPLYGVPTGIRSVGWQPLKPATLIWVEALDGGDPEKQVPHRDKLMTLSAPFTGEPREIMKIQNRYAGIQWLQTEGLGFLTDRDWRKRWRTTYLVSVDDSDFEPKKLFDLSYQDRYNDPGYPVRILTPAGESLILQDKGWIYLSGSGSSPKGDFPFLDRMNIKTMEKERLFHCADSCYERFVDFLGDSRKEIIISHESKTEPPNYYIFNLKTKKMTSLTDYKDPAPQMTGMKKELIKYERKDGVPLYGTLYLPPDYKEGEKLPLVIWAYPREYNDPQLAGQIRGSAYRFTFFRGTSQLFYVTQGYAVLDGAQMPVLGDPKTMNDTFVEQIVAAAKAAIDKLDSMGVIDRSRVGVGGHSYGAFMTANLLAHCDLFAAGVARSGAYNRTLTPFGFQSERRTLWQAPDIYFKVSPFMHAHKINEPILLIHGEADNNSGTFPIQSRRLYHALKGHGATARLVMLPNESHGYRAEESVLHVLAEMTEWFDEHVKKK
ncbi:MAG: prolyl oligopeptidase family serine peptidase [Candidatus Aminicenantes bacterium]|jgi:dipeptidyl aminopeptidase/acylaminoacyl peptidase